MTSLADSETAKRLARIFLPDTDTKPSNTSSKTEAMMDEIAEKPSVDMLVKRVEQMTKREKISGEATRNMPSREAPPLPPQDVSKGYNFHQATVNVVKQEGKFGGNKPKAKDNFPADRGINKVPVPEEKTEEQSLQFSMDAIVHQIRDDIIERCRRICEKATQLRYEKKPDTRVVPDELRADLEKRLADLIILGERSTLSKHTLCVFELECHFHIKIAMVHIEGPTESIDKAVQLYRMGQYAEALPMLEAQLEKTDCFMHELIAGCMFNLGKIEDAGYHFQKALMRMTNREVKHRTIKTEKQQANLVAAAKNAKAKAGESLKNKQYEDAHKFYFMANVLFSGVESRQEGTDGMILSMGGMNDVIQSLMKVEPVDGGSQAARDALRSLLEMHDLFSDVINNSDGIEAGYRDHCQALCLNIVGLAFECTGRFASAVNRYKEASECYSRIPDDKQRILRMRDCTVKARHAVRALAKQVGGTYTEGEIPAQVRLAMSHVLQMHNTFMAVCEKATVDIAFIAENQAESLNSIGIGYYELRQYEQAESKLTQGIELLKEKIGPDCKIITLAQLTYNIGLLYQDIGQMQKAKQNFQEARLLYNKIEDAETRAEGMRKAEEALDDIS